MISRARNPNIKPAPNMGDSTEHRILKSNIRKSMLNQGSENIKYEKANLEVVNREKKIAVECGQSDGTKLLDVYNNVYRGIQKIREF